MTNICSQHSLLLVNLRVKLLKEKEKKNKDFSSPLCVVALLKLQKESFEIVKLILEFCKEQRAMFINEERALSGEGACQT